MKLIELSLEEATARVEETRQRVEEQEAKLAEGYDVLDQLEEAEADHARALREQKAAAAAAIKRAEEANRKRQQELADEAEKRLAPLFRKLVADYDDLLTLGHEVLETLREATETYSELRGKAFAVRAPEGAGSEPGSIWVSKPDGLGWGDGRFLRKPEVEHLLKAFIHEMTSGRRWALVDERGWVPMDTEYGVKHVERLRSLAASLSDDDGDGS